MKRANATFGGKPSKQSDDQRRPSDSHSRLSSARTPAPGSDVERARWASCEEAASPAPSAERRPQVSVPKAEPRTGVMRRMDSASNQREASVVTRSPVRASNTNARPTRPREGRSDGSSAEWSCLEWGQPARERRAKRNSKVTIVQLSKDGDLLRQNGPDTWLPDAGDFMQRMASLVAHGLGFERCRSVCLRGSNAVLTVAEAGDAKVVVVSGPLGSMTNVLRRAGLQ